MVEEAAKLARKSKCKRRGGNWHDPINLCVIPPSDYELKADKLDCTCDFLSSGPENCTCEVIIDGKSVGVGKIDEIEHKRSVDLGIESV